MKKMYFMLVSVGLLFCHSCTIDTWVGEIETLEELEESSETETLAMDVTTPKG